MTNVSKRRTYGPKPFDDMDKRDHTVSSRLNPAELALLDERRTLIGMRRGEYLRTAALKQLPPTIPAINRDAWSELARLAANLNQLTRHLNQGFFDDELNALRLTISMALTDNLDVLKQVRCLLLGIKPIASGCHPHES